MPTLNNRCAGHQRVSAPASCTTGNGKRDTYYPCPLSPSPCTITTVDRCSVRAGNTTGGGILLNMAGRPTLEAIVLLLQLRRLMLACLALRKEVPLMLDKMRDMGANFSHSKYCVCDVFVPTKGAIEVRVYSYKYGEPLRKSARIYGVRLMALR